jgi:hypothetical protein
VDQEVNDLYSEFQMEKEDLLDSIRMLHQQMLLKDSVIGAFIPQVGPGGQAGLSATAAGPQARVSAFAPTAVAHGWSAGMIQGDCLTGALPAVVA